MYPDFKDVKMDFDDKYSNYVDTDVKMVEEAARRFFSKPDPMVPDNKVEFERKTSDAQVSLKNHADFASIIFYFFILSFDVSDRPALFAR